MDSLNIYLLGIYYVPDIDLCTWDTSVNKTQIFLFWILYYNRGNI